MRTNLETQALMRLAQSRKRKTSKEKLTLSPLLMRLIAMPNEKLRVRMRLKRLLKTKLMRLKMAQKKIKRKRLELKKLQLQMQMKLHHLTRKQQQLMRVNQHLAIKI